MGKLHTLHLYNQELLHRQHQEINSIKINNKILIRIKIKVKEVAKVDKDEDMGDSNKILLSDNPNTKISNSDEILSQILEVIPPKINFLTQDNINKIREEATVVAEGAPISAEIWEPLTKA